MYYKMHPNPTLPFKLGVLLDRCLGKNVHGFAEDLHKKNRGDTGMGRMGREAKTG